MSPSDIRPLAAEDAEALAAFFGRIPEGDRTFFREDVLDPSVIERWLHDEGAARLVAVIGDAIVGYLAVLSGVAWSSHVAEVRIVVDPAARRHGLGRALARRAVGEAVAQGASKLVVEVVSEQEATVGMFTSLGFEAEGLLRDHVRSRDGEVHDLLVLAHFVDDLWPAMETAGIGDVVEPS